ncbi:MAG TPA: hypothetical protein VFF52_17770 [Isosphaeraceae bacterium]|nr:hypothetical protein [Isosphaeraceae bacterium]
MRYLLSAKVRPETRAELLAAIDAGRFGEGFPYGDLGSVLARGRVDDSGTIRWVEVCYCREFSGVAMDEEIGYFEEYLTEITIADARSPRSCEGYPACKDCDCTRKVRFPGEPFLDYLRRNAAETHPAGSPQPVRPTRWLGWRGQVTPAEAQRNGAGPSAAGGSSPFPGPTLDL